MSQVYFLKLKNPSNEELKEVSEKIAQCWGDFFVQSDNVAIKLHFGERKSKTYLSPVLVKALYEKLQVQVEKAVLMDSNVLYKGERARAESHKKLALDNGFNFAPIVIADGEKGNEEIQVEINQKHFQKVRLGIELKNYNKLLVISHFKGHSACGFGGAIKNIGMGLGSKSGKLAMHKAFNLIINKEVCTGCGACVRNCPSNALYLENNKAKIDFTKCIHCGQCISECPLGAIQIPWGDSSSAELQEKIVEYTYGALLNRPAQSYRTKAGRSAFFINVLLGITQRCDCVNVLQEPMMEDIGILASTDIVSIDQASLDLAGKNHFTSQSINPQTQINYAEKLGLGEKSYQFIEI